MFVAELWVRFAQFRCRRDWEMERRPDEAVGRAGGMREHRGIGEEQRVEGVRAVHRERRAGDDDVLAIVRGVRLGGERIGGEGGGSAGGVAWWPAKPKAPEGRRTPEASPRRGAWLVAPASWSAAALCRFGWGRHRVRQRWGHGVAVREPKAPEARRTPKAPPRRGAWVVAPASWSAAVLCRFGNRCARMESGRGLPHAKTSRASDGSSGQSPAGKRASSACREASALRTERGQSCPPVASRAGGGGQDCPRSFGGRWDGRDFMGEWSSGFGELGDAAAWERGAGAEAGACPDHRKLA
jgi:hypothetical protein